jgi:hypothetical protein
MTLRAMLYLGTLALAGCGYTTNAGGEAPAGCERADFERRLQPLRAAIDAEIGDAEASNVAACRALPLGAKPCGGPWTYLVYSAEASDPERLSELAAEYDAVDAERNRACELVSDCMMVMPPDVALEGGRCVAAR